MSRNQEARKPDPNRTVTVRNLTPMVLKLHVDPRVAEKARDKEVIGICEHADVLILGHGLGTSKRHIEDVPGELEVPGWLWDAALAYDPPAHRDGAKGEPRAFQAKLIAGYERAGDLQIRGA